MRRASLACVCCLLLLSAPVAWGSIMQAPITPTAAASTSFLAAALRSSNRLIASSAAKLGATAGMAKRRPHVIGRPPMASSDAGNAAGLVRAFAFRGRISGTASSIHVYLGLRSRATKLLVGLYSSVRGRPGGRFTYGSITSPRPGAWNSAKIRRASVTSGNTYWLVILGKGGPLALRTSRSPACSNPVSYALQSISLPTSWAGATSSRTCQIAAYVGGTPRAVLKHGPNAPATPSTLAGAGTAVTGGSSGSGAGTLTSGGGGGGATPPTLLPPIALTPPTLSGTAQQRQTLTTSNGAWLDGPTSYRYQWQDCNSSGESCTISGATSQAYTLGSSDVGHTIKSVVQACNSDGCATAASAATGVVSAASTSTNCLSQLRTGGSTQYPVWSSVVACGYPAPTSLDPNGASSGGTAGVPDGTSLRNASTCGCLPSGDSWNSSGYLYVNGTGTLSDLFVPGAVYIATPGTLTIQNSNIEVPAGGSGYAVDGNGNSGLTITNSWIHTAYSGQTCTQTTAYSSQDIGLGNFGAVTLHNDDVDCFGIPLNNSNLTVTGSVIISDGMSNPTHNEPIYTGHNDTIVGNTIVNPEQQTAEVFGDQNCGGCGTLTDLTIEDNLLAGNQNNGGLAVGCAAGNGQQMDFGHGPNVSVVIENNRFTTAYNTYWHASFLAGTTDGQSGTVWSGNYMDDNLATASALANPC